MKINKPKNLNNLVLSTVVAAVLSACGGGGSCANCSTSGVSSQLVFVAPSILPSLSNKTGINYMGVYNTSDVGISGIKYSLGQQVGSGTSITLDAASAAACANIAAKSSCFLKFSVPELTIAGGAVVTASNSAGIEAATPLAIGVQQISYIESANANGVGLYFYPKAQYSESGVPFILVTAVVQSPNVGTINTIELVDEAGNVIPNQVVTSNNAGPGSSPLQMGDVVEIALPLPQGVNLTQNMKVQTSYQTATSPLLSSLAGKLNLKSKALNATTNSSTSTAAYTLTTQGNNINLQFTPNQVYLTATNPIQYGYLYNIGDLTASQIQVSSGSPNVRVTASDAILSGQRVIKVTYELVDKSVVPTTNTVTVTAQNPSGETETTTGNTNQNVNPDVVPTPAPSLPQLTVAANPSAPVAGGTCSTVSASIPATTSNPVTVAFTVTPSSPSAYGFGTAGGSSFSTTTSCTITSPDVTCSPAAGSDLCAATGSDGTAITVTASATGYKEGSVPVTIASATPPLPQLTVTTNQSPVADGACSTVTATVPSPVSVATPVTLAITPSSNNYGFGSSPSGPFASTASCTIASGSTSCGTSDGVDLCAATGTGGTAINVTASATGYSNGTQAVTIAVPTPVPVITMATIPNPLATIMMGNKIQFTATISVVGSSVVSANLANSVAGTIVSEPSPCALSVDGPTTCTFTVIPWDTALFPNSIVGASNFDPYTTNNTGITITATNSASINTSPVAFTMTTPYVYLQAPMVGAASESNTGVTWGSGGTALATRFIAGKDPSNNICTAGQEIESDTLTGLTWIKDATAVCGSGSGKTWSSTAASGSAQEAINNTNSAGYCGYSNWRLPTINEFISLANYALPQTDTAPADWLNANGFSGVVTGFYWTSNVYYTSGGAGTRAWNANLAKNVSSSYASVGTARPCMAVRSPQ